MIAVDQIEQSGLAGDDGEIARLLHPVSPARLLHEFWGKKPLHISGEPARFIELFDRDRFDAAIARAHAAADPSFAVCCFTQDFDGAWTCSEAIDPDQVESFVAANRTVCVRNIAAGDEALMRFGKNFAAHLQLMGTVGFNAYLSGEGSGADLHFDRSITCALQLEGRKKWRYARSPAVPWPPGNGRMQADGVPIYAAPWFGHDGWDTIPDGDFDTDEVVLEPGDWLILPAGTWHEAKAIGHSFALNMLFSPWPLQNLVFAALQKHFEADAAWRGGVPGDIGIGTQRGPGLEAYLAARIAELSQALEAPLFLQRLKAACDDFAESNRTGE